MICKECLVKYNHPYIAVSSGHTGQYQRGTEPWPTCPNHTTAPGSIANPPCCPSCTKNLTHSPAGSSTLSSSSTRSAWNLSWRHHHAAAAGHLMTVPPLHAASSPKPC